MLYIKGSLKRLRLSENSMLQLQGEEKFKKRNHDYLPMNFLEKNSEQLFGRTHVNSCSFK